MIDKKAAYLEAFDILKRCDYIILSAREAHLKFCGTAQGKLTDNIIGSGSGEDSYNDR